MVIYLKNTILIDLGDTLVRNNEISIENGLSSIYDYLNLKHISLKKFVDYGIKLFDLICNKRQKTNIEVPLGKYLKKLFEELKIDNFLINAELERIFFENTEKDLEMLDAVVFLKYLKQKEYRIIVISNSMFSSELLKLTLKKFKLLEYIDYVYSSSDLGFRKPSKELYDLIEKQQQLKKDQCLMIGNDILIDGNFSINSNLDFIWFNEYEKKGYCSKTVINVKKYSELIERWDEIID